MTTLSFTTFKFKQRGKTHKKVLNNVSGVNFTTNDRIERANKLDECRKEYEIHSRISPGNRRIIPKDYAEIQHLGTQREVVRQLYVQICK